MHDLFGLTASSPIGFMAALGMVRVLTSDRGCKIRLGWRNGHAVIKGIEPKGAISEQQQIWTIEPKRWSSIGLIHQGRLLQKSIASLVTKWMAIDVPLKHKGLPGKN